MNESTTPTEQVHSNKNIPWHPMFNRWLKGVLTPADVDFDDEVQSISEPPMIDSRLRHDGTGWTERQRALLPDGIRDRHMQYHLLELKITESVTKASLEQAYNYDYLYRRSQNLGEDQLQTYIVSSKTPNAVTLAGWGYEVGEQPGVYVNSRPFFERVVILVLNQLRDVPHNSYFRLFASRKQVRESAMEYLMKEQEEARIANQKKNGSGNDSGSNPGFNDYQLDEQWSVLYALRNIYRLEGITMDNEMNVNDIIEMGRVEYRRGIIASSPVGERIAGLKPEEIFDALRAEDKKLLVQQVERYLAAQLPAVPNSEK